MSDLVPLVLDLRVTHDRVDRSVDTVSNGHLRYPNNLDQSLNSTSGRLHSENSTSGTLHSEFIRI